MMLKMLAVGTAVCALLAGSASAAIVIDATPPFPTVSDENILLTEDTPGLQIQGETNNTGQLVDFLGLETLVAPSNGQARIEAAVGGYSSLEIFMDDPLLAFTGLELNLDALADGEVSFFVLGIDNVVTPGVFSIGTSGQNFFTIYGTNGSAIKRVSFTTDVDLSDVAQIRIGGVEAISAIPEPATWGLLITGFGLTGAMLRRSRRRPVLAT